MCVRTYRSPTRLTSACSPQLQPDGAKVLQRVRDASVLTRQSADHQRSILERDRCLGRSQSRASVPIFNSVAADVDPPWHAQYQLHYTRQHHIFKAIQKLLADEFDAVASDATRCRHSTEHRAEFLRILGAHRPASLMTAWELVAAADTLDSVRR